MRLDVLRGFAERLADASAGPPRQGRADDVLLRAQLVLAAGIGIAVLRSPGGIEPLASATDAELAQPLNDLVAALLPGIAAEPPRPG